MAHQVKHCSIDKTRGNNVGDYTTPAMARLIEITNLCEAERRRPSLLSIFRPGKDKRAHLAMDPLYLVRLAGIEPTTPWFVAKYSIQLSYSRERKDYSTPFLTKGRAFSKKFHRHFPCFILLSVSASSYAVTATICFMMIPLYLSLLPATPYPMSDHTAAERIREQERLRIAHDLHDELGSHLTALKMALAQLQQRLGPLIEADDVHRQLAYADQLVDGAVNAMHDIIDDLHPAVLALGLPSTLTWLAQSFARQTGVPHDCAINNSAADVSLDSFTLVNLYRISREALHNTARHAQARRVTITLSRQAARLLLEISDDGIGLPADDDSHPDSAGIRGMQARAAAIGASLTLASGAQGGCKLQISLPVTVA
jgi:two-component sensor histidine kinase